MMNAALAEVKSDFVYYFAADDTYNPHTVEWCEKLLARFPDVAMISGNARTVEVETGRERRFALPFPQEIGAYGAEDLKKAAQSRAMTFLGGSNVFRRSVLQAMGGQRPELKWHADWFMYLQIARRYPFGIIRRKWRALEKRRKLFGSQPPMGQARPADCNPDPPFAMRLCGRLFFSPRIAHSLAQQHDPDSAGCMVGEQLRDSRRKE